MYPLPLANGDAQAGRSLWRMVCRLSLVFPSFIFLVFSSFFVFLFMIMLFLKYVISRLPVCWVFMPFLPLALPAAVIMSRPPCPVLSCPVLSCPVLSCCVPWPPRLVSLPLPPSLPPSRFSRYIDPRARGVHAAWGMGRAEKAERERDRGRMGWKRGERDEMAGKDEGREMREWGARRVI